MFKFAVALFALIACAAAKPGVVGVAPLAYSAPLVAPGVVTATSSQVIARNYNGIAAPLVAAAPIAAPLAYSAPLAAAYTAPIARYASPYALPAPYTAAYAAPYTSAYAPYTGAAYAAPYTSAYAPYAAPFGYGAPAVASPLIL